MEMNTERPVVIIPSGKSMYRICQGGRTLGFASSFEWAKTRRAMIREGVLDVPALVPALKLAS
ncbi:MAG: hypothetical protein ACRCWH_21465 [Aeromonas veronii]